MIELNTLIDYLLTSLGPLGAILVAIIAGALWMLISDFIKNPNKWRKFFMFWKKADKKEDILVEPIEEPMAVPTKEDDSVLQYTRNMSAVKDFLTTILHLTKSSRIVLWRFHNGGGFAPWIPGISQTIKKMSFQLEVLDSPAVASLSNYFGDRVKNIDLAEVYWWVIQTHEGKMRYENTEEVEDIVTRQFYRDFSIESVVCVPLYQEGKLTGIASIEWVDEKPNFSDFDVPQHLKPERYTDPKEYSDDLYNYLKDQMQRIELFLRNG